MKTFKNNLPGRPQTGWLWLVLMIAVGLLPQTGAAVGTWAKITNFPYSSPSHMLLLTDGTVMVQNYEGTAWYGLKPDGQGHYLNGQWSTLTSMESPRLFYSSDVLQNGEVFVAGGEDPQFSTNSPATNFGNTNAEVFNPLANGGSGSWRYVNPPTSLFDPSSDGFSDSDSILLADGKVLITPVSGDGGNECLIFNPNNSTWEATDPSLVWQDEATWIKLPDDSILTIDTRYPGANSTTAERYIPSLGKWVKEHDTPCSTDGLGDETGAGFMLADGRAFFLLGSGHTLFYKPTGNTNAGAWEQGPDMPLLNTSQYPASPVALSTNNGVVTYNNYLQLTTEDAPAAMLPSGKVLCEISRDAAHMPVWFYEFDPSAKEFIPAPSPNNVTAGSYYNVKGDNSDSTSMLDLPDGTVLYNDSETLYIYTPDSTPALAGGQPVINSVNFNADGSLHLSGTVFNGISQGVSYGDDCQMDSNYPLVRFTDSSGNVTYGRTYNWSSTGVQTGGKIVTTECTVPAGVLDSQAAYSLQVVANGNASAPVTFYGPVWVNFNYYSFFGFYFGTFPNPYDTLALGVGDVDAGGTIAIDASTQPSASHETMTISKPMTIVSINGPSTIGH